MFKQVYALIFGVQYEIPAMMHLKPTRPPRMDAFAARLLYRSYSATSKNANLLRRIFEYVAVMGDHKFFRKRKKSRKTIVIIGKPIETDLFPLIVEMSPAHSPFSGL